MRVWLRHVSIYDPVTNSYLTDWKKSTWEWYDGSVAEAKKGREIVEDAAKKSGKLADTADQWAGENRADTEPFAKSLIPGQSGGLSPYVKAQLDRQKSDIAKTYGDIAQTGMRAATARGFGSAPSGNIASIYNTAGRNAGEAERNAYADAMDRTLNAGITGINYLDPNKPLQESVAATGQQGDLGFKRGQMGSTAGDILNGIGQGLKIGSTIAGGGGFANIGRKILRG